MVRNHGQKPPRSCIPPTASRRAHGTRVTMYDVPTDSRPRGASASGRPNSVMATAFRNLGREGGRRRGRTPCAFAPPGFCFFNRVLPATSRARSRFGSRSHPLVCRVPRYIFILVSDSPAYPPPLVIAECGTPCALLSPAMGPCRIQISLERREESCANLAGNHPGQPRTR
jgi:hypothetical protein